MRIFSKRSETVPLDSWHYLPSKFKNFSNKKRNLNFNPWGGKRVSLYRPITTIRRPIRVPFGSWGGKRGKEYLQSIINSQMKKSKYVNYQDDEGILFDGYNVKRMAEGGTGRKIPFNSWGGKRSEEVDDLHQKQVTLMMDNNVDSNEKYTRNNIEGDFPDGNNVKNAVDKRVEQTKLKSHTKFSSWGGKRNSFDYQPLSNPITASNETSNDYTMKEETDGSDWLIFIPDKRTDGGQLKNINFYPWGGKRSSETLVFPIDDDYIETLAESMK